VVLEDPRVPYDALLQAGVRRLRGHPRRLFLAEVTQGLCGGSARQAERRFGWGRDTVTKGLQELRQGSRCQDNFSARGRPRWEEQDPQRAEDLRALVEPRCHADPELKSARRYTNLSAAEVLQALKAHNFWADALRLGWLQVRGGYGHIRRLVIYLDNGPNNSGSRTQFLKRMVEFADWSGLELRLVYYPPYHSKYNPLERCWSALENKWSGTLRNSLKVILQYALRMTWRGKHPVVKRLPGDYPAGVRLTKKERKPYEARLQRSQALRKYDITIKPKPADRQVN
jgi:transposase